MSTHDDGPELRRSAQLEFDRRAIGMVAHLLTMGMSLERKIANAPRLLIALADRSDSMSTPGPRISTSTLPIDRSSKEQISRGHASSTGDPLLRCVPGLELTTDSPATRQKGGIYQWA
jgi:hypothetical protein